MRVGFLLQDGSWLGGRNYFRNLLTAIYRLPDAAIEPVIFSRPRQSDTFGDFPPFPVIRSSVLDARRPLGFLRWRFTQGLSNDLLLARVLRKHGVPLLSHSRVIAGPTIGWIPDFQHVYLPEFFTTKERARRDRVFMRVCRHSVKVIVSSECARADLASFAPEFAQKAAVLRFTAIPESPAGLRSLPELQQQYGFEGPYFLLPNQFWAHKNHRVVIDALRLLKQSDRPIVVLATGSIGDFRNPALFDSLMAHARECGMLGSSFRVLGAIPFADLSALMRNATAIVNPSLFEGWSTTVEEAKSLGKRMILSDIPVHREQAPDGGLYFPPKEAAALADALASAMDAFDAQDDAAMQQRARDLLPARQRSFAETYQNIVASVQS